MSIPRPASVGGVNMGPKWTIKVHMTGVSAGRAAGGLLLLGKRRLPVFRT